MSVQSFSSSILQNPRDNKCLLFLKDRAVRLVGNGLTDALFDCCIVGFNCNSDMVSWQLGVTVVAEWGDWAVWTSGVSSKVEKELSSRQESLQSRERGWRLWYGTWHSYHLLWYWSLDCVTIISLSLSTARRIRKKASFGGSLQKYWQHYGCSLCGLTVKKCLDWEWL